MNKLLNNNHKWEKIEWENPSYQYQNEIGSSMTHSMGKIIYVSKTGTRIIKTTTHDRANGWHVTQIEFKLLRKDGYSKSYLHQIGEDTYWNNIPKWISLELNTDYTLIDNSTNNFIRAFENNSDFCETCGCIECSCDNLTYYERYGCSIECYFCPGVHECYKPIPCPKCNSTDCYCADLEEWCDDCDTFLSHCVCDSIDKDEDYIDEYNGIFQC